MALNRGAIALVRNSTPLLLTCTSPDIADLVGYGNGTTPATQGLLPRGRLFGVPTLDNTTAAIRRDGGYHDVDNNGIDFNVDLPSPLPQQCDPGPPLFHRQRLHGRLQLRRRCRHRLGHLLLLRLPLGPTSPPPCANTADFNNDGDVSTDADIESFFRVLAGGPC